MVIRSSVSFAGARYTTYSYLTGYVGKGHDRLLTADSFLGVADGATPLDPAWPDPGGFADRSLHGLMRSARFASVEQMWGRAIASTASGEAGYRGPNVSCAATVARSAGNGVEFSMLGDCIVLAKDSAGQVRLLYDDRIPKRDQAVAALPAGEARAAALYLNRMNMNSDASYWIYSTDPRAAGHVQSMWIDKADLETFLLCTDGVLSVTAERRRGGKLSALERLVDLFSSLDLEGLSARINSLLATGLASDDMAIIIGGRGCAGGEY